MNWPKLISLFLLLSTTPMLSHGVDPLKSQLKSYGVESLSVPLVLRLAIENADAYQILGLSRKESVLEEMGQLDSLTDTYLQMGVDYLDDNSVKTSGFQPVRSQQATYNLGVQKNWSTGTSTFVGWEYLDFDSEFAAFAQAQFGPVIVPAYKQSVATIRLEQDLLKNSFGSSFDQKLLAARKRAAAIKWSVRDGIESLSLRFVLQFYEAWLAREQVLTFSEQLKRQKRLVAVLVKRNKKGAVEDPDLIQFQAVLTTTETRLQEARMSLDKQWESLIVALKLPSSLLDVDPLRVPLTLDEPVSRGLELCTQDQPSKTTEIVGLEKRLEALSADYQAADGDSLPDLKLVAGYRGNSIDNSASVTFENVLAGADRNGFGRGPAWNVGLQLNWPLNQSQARALKIQKNIEKQKVAAELHSAVDQLRVDWRDTCRRLKGEFRNMASYARVVKQQEKRVRAESRRFSVGRSSVNQLVTSEDDLGLWQFENLQKKIQARKLAWSVQKMSGDLYKSIEAQVQENVYGARP